MTISPELGLAIMFNNYFHDVATALLLGSAMALWTMLKKFDPKEGPAAVRTLLLFHESMTKLARFALGWIIIAGVPRAYFFMDFEWVHAVGKMQVPALVLKHVLITVLVVLGAVLWFKLKRRVAELRGTAEGAGVPVAA